MSSSGKFEAPGLRNDAKILIVGAGPSGLTAAAFLTRQNIAFDVIDTRSGPVNDSRALGVHARTLEFMSMLGLDQEFLDQGHPTRYMTWHRGGRKLFKLDFNSIADQTRYPFMLVLPQARSERILIEHLRRKEVAICWQTTLRTFNQANNCVTVEIQLADERIITREYTYVIGCDGAGSVLRTGCNIAFEGETYPMRFLLSEVKIANNAIDRSSSHVFMGEKTTVAVIPQPDEIYRVVGPDFSRNVDAEASSGASSVVFDDFAAFLKKNNLLQHVDMHEPSRLVSYRIQKRVAANFRKGRIFLVGDAAHIHSPAGGQGMNTGLHDAVNLSWKLAAVLNGRAQETLLDTYEAERRPAAIRIVTGADQAMMRVVSRKFGARLLFDWVAPIALQFYQPRDLMAKISQIYWAYPGFRDLPNYSDDRTVRSGARLADWDTRGGGSANRYLGTDRLVAFASGNSTKVAEMKRRIQNWSEPHRPAIHELAMTPNATSSQPGFDGIILARPDGYIATAYASSSEGALEALQVAAPI